MVFATKKASFKAFVVSDTIAMILSVGTVWFYFLMATAFHLGGKVHARFFLCGCILTVFGMGAMVVAFMTGLYALDSQFSLLVVPSAAAAISLLVMLYLKEGD